MENMNILAKISEACPLDCVYCYEGDKSGRIMDESTLDIMIQKILQRTDARRTNFIWHGAEPLAAGLEFYIKAKALQKKYLPDKHKITNGMQSNGVLLTPEIADSFAKEDIDIGFSLDGPKHLHDKTRPYVNGRSSFDHTLRAMKLMNERGKKPGVIAVLTKLSLPYLDEIYDFFKTERINFKINPLIDCGCATTKLGEIGLNVVDRIEALKYIFDKWFYDKDTKKPVDYGNGVSLARAIFTKGGSSCDMLESCQDSFIGVSSQGLVFPCSRYSEEEMSYGNIHTNSLDEIINHPLRQKLLKRYEGLSECKACEYNFMCYSGCMHNAHIKGDIMGKDPNCAVNKQLYEHIATRILEQLAYDGAIKQKLGNIETKDAPNYSGNNLNSFRLDDISETSVGEPNILGVVAIKPESEKPVTDECIYRTENKIEE